MSSRRVLRFVELEKPILQGAARRKTRWRDYYDADLLAEIRQREIAKSSHCSQLTIQKLEDHITETDLIVGVPMSEFTVKIDARMFNSHE